MPLTGLGGGNYDDGHDWYQILSRTGRLDQDTQIASNLRMGGKIAVILGLSLGAVLIILMFIGWWKRFKQPKIYR
jgi:hypothetical protein